MSLQQGSRSAAEFSVQFRTVTLRGLFLSSLNEPIKNELATRDEADSLEEVISLFIRLANCLCERRRERAVPCLRLLSPTPSESCSPSLPVVRAVFEEKPMQLGRTRLTQAQGLKRIRIGVCLYCALPGHLISACPSLPKDEAQQ